MADDARRHDETDEAPPRTTMAEHEATYNAFLTLTKWSIAVVVLLLIGMAVFLV